MYILKVFHYLWGSCKSVIITIFVQLSILWLLWHRNFIGNCFILHSWDYGVAKKLKSTCGGKAAWFSFRVSCPFHNTKSVIDQIFSHTCFVSFRDSIFGFSGFVFKELIKFSGTFSNINTYVTLPADLSRHKNSFWSVFSTEIFFWNWNSAGNKWYIFRDVSVKNSEDDSCIGKVNSTENVC